MTATPSRSGKVTSASSFPVSSVEKIRPGSLRNSIIITSDLSIAKKFGNSNSHVPAASAGEWLLQIRLKPHYLSQLFLCLSLGFIKGMGIDIQCGTWLGVTKQSCNGADIHTLGNEQTGVGMAQAVDR